MSALGKYWTLDTPAFKITVETDDLYPDRVYLQISWGDKSSVDVTLAFDRAEAKLIGNRLIMEASTEEESREPRA